MRHEGPPAANLNRPSPDPEIGSSQVPPHAGPCCAPVRHAPCATGCHICPVRRTGLGIWKDVRGQTFTVHRHSAPISMGNEITLLNQELYILFAEVS